MGHHAGNEWVLAPDRGRAGITPKVTPPARFKGGAWRVKTRPVPPRNELYIQFDSAQAADSNTHSPSAVPPLVERLLMLLYLSSQGKSLLIVSY